MRVLTVFLSLALIGVSVYTLLTVTQHGWNFMQVFLTDLFCLTWRGQFNLDFMTYLMLSALWVAWRGGFSAGAIGLALGASVLGMPYLAAYILIQMRKVDSLEELLLGVHAARTGRRD